MINCEYCGFEMLTDEESMLLNVTELETKVVVRYDPQGKPICPDCIVKKAEIFTWLMIDDNFNKLKSVVEAAFK